MGRISIVEVKLLPSIADLDLWLISVSVAEKDIAERMEDTCHGRIGSKIEFKKDT